MFKTKIYSQSPIRIQEALISCRSAVRRLLRRNAYFRRTLAEIERNEWLDEDALRQFQLEKLLMVIRHAADNVPYYCDAFKRAGVRPDDIKTLEGIREIPYLTRRDILERQKALLASNIKGLKLKSSTSGTTGTPITIWQNLDAIIREHAFVWRQLRWACYKPGEPLAWIRGDMIVPFNQQKSPFWRFDRTENMLMISSYHLSQEFASSYVKALSSFDPVVIKAYPSSIFYLSKFLENAGQKYKGRRLRSIVTSSETLTGEQRATIEERMNCRVADYYGHTERVVSIGTCEEGSYHVNSDYSFLELCTDTENQGEIVGTGFNNYLMPLVRYKTNDVIVMEDRMKTCPCGRRFPLVKEIRGRMDDYLKTKDGRRVGRLGHIFRGLRNIAEAQIRQDSLDEVRILVVPFGSFGLRDKKDLLSNAAQRLGEDMKVNVEVVSEIPRTKQGKFRAVICNV